MTESRELIDALDARVKRRENRRAFFTVAMGAAAVGAGFAVATAAEAQTVTDADILNFALNLEYLEANFYYFAAFGTSIPLTSTAGTGTFGAATGGRAVTFTDPAVRSYSQEIVADELNHVNFLRSALGSAAVAQPQIDVGIAPNGAFSSAARAAGLIGPTTATSPTFFDPYASDENFLLGSFIFEDVGVTAYKGASPLISNPAYLTAAAGILAVEAYHAGLVRTVLYRKGIGTPASGTTAAVPANPSLISSAGAISAARDSLDGPTALDQGIATQAGAFGNQSNLTPTDGNAIAFSRSTGQVLNIVYLNHAAVTAGGFFPAGVNGTIKTSAAN
ncbi:ferritin-like domain-containing protein [uncultured Sphingomonas sp.]|uniref:ferritin-like domain-containing protein n=1 Tax=uncultured Sphingomonas sp. TaxID=158754 RepID=UPI0035C9E34B